ncbi:MAG: hypothetical protein ACT4QD_09140 [Acidobacteriota bacterium]
MRPLIPILLVLLAASWPVDLYADYKDIYRQAIQARNRGRWADVARYMRQAIAEQPLESDERINISGMDFVPYVPHYYLGLALFNQKDCVGALASWQTSEAQGTVRRLAEGSNLLRFRKQCESRLASGAGAGTKPAPGKPEVTEKPVAANRTTPPEKPAAPAAAAPSPAAVTAATQAAVAALTRAEEAGRTIDQLESDPLLGKVWSSEAALGATTQKARSALTQARNELEAGRRDSALPRLQESANQAASASQLFEGVRQSALARREEMQRASLVAVPLNPSREERPAAAPPPPTPPPTPTAVRREAAPAAASVTPSAPPPRFTPPAALTSAARLFFSARYKEAATSLSRLRYSAGPAAAHAALLLAATRYSLYVVGGERDQALLDQARRDAIECHRLAPGMKPDPRAFSPRFIDFYASATSS